MKTKLSTKKIVVSALMAALVCVASAIRVVIPVDIGGNTAFHLGNIFCKGRCLYKALWRDCIEVHM